MEQGRDKPDGFAKPAGHPIERRRLNRFIGGAVLVIAFLIVLYVLLVVGDALAGDPLGGPVIGPMKFDKQAYGQTIGQLASSLTDSSVNIMLGLFALVGFSLSRDLDHQKSHMFWKLGPLCIFGGSSVLSAFFAIKFKAGLLLQLQYDRVNIKLLEPMFSAHLFCLLLATLSSFAIALLCLGPLARERRHG